MSSNAPQSFPACLSILLKISEMRARAGLTQMGGLGKSLPDSSLYDRGRVLGWLPKLFGEKRDPAIRWFE